MLKFEEYKKMKKGNFSFIGSGRRKYIVDTSLINKMVFSDEWSNAEFSYPIKNIKRITAGKCNAEIAKMDSAVFTNYYFHFETPEGRKYYADFETQNTVIRKNGKLAYYYIKVIFIRLYSYHPISKHRQALPDLCQYFGEFSKSGVYESEIS